MKLTRRRLLCDAVAGMAALGVATAAPRTSKMRFGLTSYQWGKDWDVPTTIANCTKAKAFGVELRTQEKYAAGVEVSLTAAERREVRKRFADSGVKLVGLACSERYDWPDAAKLNEAIESTRRHLQLCHDVGGHGLRVFPNDYHKEVPPEKTIVQISRALNTVGRAAAGHGQLIRIENHGTAGDLASLRKIMDGVDQKNVRIKLNGHPADAEDFAKRFAPLKNLLDDTLHFHELDQGNFPYQLQSDLLIDAGWDGWWLLEASSKVEDRLQAVIGQREIWERMVAKSVQR
jgi:sugar phosphate isomerase/epimerase